MKQSLQLVYLQIISIILGFTTLIYVASSLPAELFAITAIYSVTSSLIIIFSNTGLETYAMRNVLVWKENEELDKIRLVISQAIFLRICFAFVLVAPMIVYSYYISKYKFDGEYFSLFVFMTFLSIIAAINESLALLLKSFNKYLSAAFIFFVINILGKILAFVLFLKFVGQLIVYLKQ